MDINAKQKIKKIVTSWEFILFMILVAEFVIFGFANFKKFMRISSILSSINNYISICIISLFVTFVMITGGIDIQASSIVGLTSIIIGVLWSDVGLNIWASVLIAIIAAAACGGLSGFFVAYCGVQPMVVTLGGSFLYSGIALLISSLSATPAYQGISGFPAKTELGEFTSFRAIGKFKLFDIIPIQIIIFALLVLICYLLLHKSKYGRKVFLIGVNPKAAEYSGINTRLIIMSTYILTGIGAAIAGILLTANVDSAKYNLGSTFTLSIITAVVLGGTLSTGGKGSIIGTALAALVICILRYGLPLCFNVSTQNLDLPVGMMLILVVTIRAMAGNPKVVAFFEHWKKKRKKENFSANCIPG
ncbi:MAG TPA: ABC transporter permease [Spirochaetia bacterium]|jgi:AI-2 transport system permease protein|nr:ABC transporter permease [Spirochaetia bacterium]